MQKEIQIYILEQQYTLKMLANKLKMIKYDLIKTKL
jgi:hypothetical protein